jgi:hypothetical protein
MDKKTGIFGKRKIIYLLLIVIAILSGYMLYKWNEGGMWVVHWYYRPGHFFSGKERVLAIAAGKGDVKKIDALVVQGANVNAVGKNNEDESTILEWACIAWAVGEKNLNGIERLLQLGADPNFIQRDGSSVMLMVGIGENDAPLLKLLLEHGGNPNIRDPVERNILSNNTPVLIRAAQRGRLENIKLLLQYGADINITDGFGLTALLWAASSNSFDITYYLLQQGADYKKFGFRPLALNHTPDFRLGIVDIIHESLRYGLSDDEIPWREKVIKWLEARGVVISPAVEENSHITEISDNFLDAAGNIQMPLR